MINETMNNETKTPEEIKDLEGILFPWKDNSNYIYELLETKFSKNYAAAIAKVIRIKSELIGMPDGSTSYACGLVNLDALNSMRQDAKNNYDLNQMYKSIYAYQRATYNCACEKISQLDLVEDKDSVTMSYLNSAAHRVNRKFTTTPKIITFHELEEVK